VVVVGGEERCRNGDRARWRKREKIEMQNFNEKERKKKAALK
jgi:hypothetical protein